jgi:hypothetical protein
VVQQPKTGPDHLMVEVSRSHTIRHTHARRHTHTHPVGLLWMSDQLVADASAYTRESKQSYRIETGRYKCMLVGHYVQRGIKLVTAYMRGRGGAVD